MKRLLSLFAIVCVGFFCPGNHGHALDATDLPPAVDHPIDFAKHIEPLLSRHCYSCHGPEQQKSGLRLDDPELALKGGDYGIAYQPGDSANSPLVHYISGVDPDVVMPPEGKALSDEEIGLIRAWIDQGAKYPEGHSIEEATPSVDPRLDHWAYRKPVRPNIPELKDASWVRTPIDAFVLAHLEKEGLSPSAEAEKRALIRRVSLDLTGLPPTSEEVDAFLNDNSVDAYEKLVDRLLASPHYGERWARWWLDLARYADTNGFEKDRPRSIWPYRDWVIQAFNQDMPFDRFTIEQMAGDMLPEAATSQIVATGFHRNTMTNEEGGIDVEQFRFESIVDRVHTTSTAFLGLTMACCQCHDHKYDPISQKEYYQFFSFLNNADEPRIRVPDPDIAAERERIAAEISWIEADYENRFPPLEERFDWTPLDPAAYSSEAGATLAKLQDGAVLAVGPHPATDVYRLRFTSLPEEIDALRIVAFVPEGYQTVGVGRAPNGNFVLSEVALSRVQAESRAELAIASSEGPIEQSGFSLASAHDGDRRTGWGGDDGSGDMKKDRLATFHLTEGWKPGSGESLEVRLDQLWGEGHTLGQIRLLAGRKVREHYHPELPVADQRRLHLLSKFAEWEQRESGKARPWEILEPHSIVSEGGATPHLLEDRSVYIDGNHPNRDTYSLEFELPEGTYTGLRLEALTHPDLPANGPGRGTVLDDGTFFLSEFLAYATPVCEASVSGEIPPATLTFQRAAATFPTSGKNTPQSSLDGSIDTGWWTQGGAGKAHSAVFEASGTFGFPGGTRLKVVLVQKYIHQQTLGRFRLSATAATGPLHPYDAPSRIEEILANSPEARSEEEKRELLQHYLSLAPELAEAHGEVARLKESMPKFATTLVLDERDDHPRTTHVHARGEFLRPGKEVEPGVPEALHDLPPDAPRNRLTFARWLASEDNPLIGRVTMNRLWLAYFGRGIVNTPEDFGVMADAPSHPELLDWLATEFVREGWSLKKMHRLIVTSAVYRQSSRVTEDLLERDPENILLARGPRFRLEAEMIRDLALRASGLLAESVGGPSVFPPQPEGVSDLAYGKPSWQTSAGEDRYRRGLYTHIKRTTPYPMFATFDGALPDTCTVSRRVSNTPLQALTLLNDEVFVEASQALAREVLDATGLSFGERVNQVYSSLLSREATPAEVDRLVEFCKAQTQRFTSGELDPLRVAFLDPEEAKEYPREKASELAAWTVICRSLLNLDETITKQ
jgi:hypothetical protein